jgi:thimet oligopeptidase
LNQNPRPYAAAKAAQPAEGSDRSALQNVRDDLVDAVVALAPAKRARAKTLQECINLLAQKFDRNLWDDRSKRSFDVAALDGVPEGIIKDTPRNAKGPRAAGPGRPDPLPGDGAGQ